MFFLLKFFCKLKYFVIQINWYFKFKSDILIISKIDLALKHWIYKKKKKLVQTDFVNIKENRIFSGLRSSKTDSNFDQHSRSSTINPVPSTFGDENMETKIFYCLTGWTNVHFLTIVVVGSHETILYTLTPSTTSGTKVKFESLTLAPFNSVNLGLTVHSKFFSLFKMIKTKLIWVFFNSISYNSIL